MDDEFWDDDVNAKVLENRIADFVRKLGVELLIADEVQHLRRKANDANEVTDRLKVFLDRGIVPLVLVGDEDSIPFFRANGKLAARLGNPLELAPLNPNGRAADAKLFKKFCGALDDELMKHRIFASSSMLTSDEMLDALLVVSSGHVGRVARLLSVAAPAAVRRGAACVEPYDLSRATRQFAIGAAWLVTDPFSNTKA
ncbi:MAG: TniB family NTP-binding protein [Janthinobacterium lividum]